MVFWLALAIRLGYCQVYFHDPSIASETGFSILGTPYSDAHGWDSFGAQLAEGAGLAGCWSALRPFYMIFLALFYTWFGPSHVLAIFLNLVASALTVALVCRIGEKVFNQTVVSAQPWF
jgi:hypothetical protein